MVYLGVCKTDEAQADVLRACTRKFRLGTDVDLLDIAQACPKTLTGADISALGNQAMMLAIERTIEALRLRYLADLGIDTTYTLDEEQEDGFSKYVDAQNDHEHTTVVTREDFLDALAKLRPSVTPEELMRYEKLQSRYTAR